MSSPASRLPILSQMLLMGGVSESLCRAGLLAGVKSPQTMSAPSLSERKCFLISSRNLPRSSLFPLSNNSKKPDFTSFVSFFKTVTYIDTFSLSLLFSLKWASRCPGIMSFLPDHFSSMLRYFWMTNGVPASSPSFVPFFPHHLGK